MKVSHVNRRGGEPPVAGQDAAPPGSQGESVGGEILRIDGLRTEFRVGGRGWVPVVHDVSLSVRRGETLGIVGESGSGKSMTMISVLGLVSYVGGRVAEGTAQFDQRDLLTMSKSELREIRGGKIGVVFQDPMTSLNPVRTIQRQMVETIRKHADISNAAARRRALELLKMVRIPDAERRLSSYPHELSGGMRQRVMIAIALSCEPELIIADEPTTALDVTVQVDVLDLLRTRTKERDVAVIIVSHDLGVIASLSDRIAVMYAGRVVEEGVTRDLLRDPQHPYTLALLSSIPSIRGQRTDRLPSIGGLPPRPENAPSGCPFHDRCPFVQDRCRRERPLLSDVAEGHGTSRRAACHFSLVDGEPRPRT